MKSKKEIVSRTGDDYYVVAGVLEALDIWHLVVVSGPCGQLQALQAQGHHEHLPGLVFLQAVASIEVEVVDLRLDVKVEDPSGQAEVFCKRWSHVRRTLAVEFHATIGGNLGVLVESTVDDAVGVFLAFAVLDQLVNRIDGLQLVTSDYLLLNDHWRKPRTRLVGAHGPRNGHDLN